MGDVGNQRALHRIRDQVEIVGGVISQQDQLADQRPIRNRQRPSRSGSILVIADRRSAKINICKIDEISTIETRNGAVEVK